MRDDRVYPLHVLDAIEWIERFAAEGEGAFIDDRKTRDAIVRNLETVGEAVKNLSPATRAACPDVPWKRIAGMRDKLIHQYFGVNLPLVWNVIKRDIPSLRRAVESILRETGAAE